MRKAAFQKAEGQKTGFQKTGFQKTGRRLAAGVVLLLLLSACVGSDAAQQEGAPSERKCQALEKMEATEDGEETGQSAQITEDGEETGQSAQITETGKEIGQQAWKQTPLLEMEEEEAARETAVSTAVRVEIPVEGQIFWGSGILWDGEGDHMIVATSAHLLEAGLAAGTDSPDLTVSLNHREALTCRLLGRSREWDVAFLEADLKEAKEGMAQETRYRARLHQRTFDTMLPGDTVWMIGCGADGIGDRQEKGSWVAADYVPETYEKPMLLLEGKADPGMSGGGVFDLYGNLVGMIAAGNGAEVTAVPMPAINQAYEEVCDKLRDTELYGE